MTRNVLLLFVTAALVGAGMAVLHHDECLADCLKAGSSLRGCEVVCGRRAVSR